MFQITLTLWLNLKQWGHEKSVLISSEIKSFQSGLSEEDNQDGKQGNHYRNYWSESLLEPEALSCCSVKDKLFVRILRTATLGSVCLLCALCITFLWKATPCAGAMPTSVTENVKMHWPLIQCGMTVWAPQKGLERARITPLPSAHKLVPGPASRSLTVESQTSPSGSWHCPKELR